MLDLPAGSELAGYRIEAMAGRGGMGVVYRATDLALERPVALKLISEEFAEDVSFRERFKRESKLAASIRHPNVITVFRAGEEDGRLYIAMDYIEGTDLKRLIARHGKLEPRLAAHIVSQVAAALDAAHAKTLVHRDVKPANVLIAEEHGSHHAYLTDFGLTKHTASESAMTGTGMVVGTIDYTAPEQIEGAPLDARADIYSLGCVLYEALTGQVPYPRDSNLAKMYAHVSESPPSVGVLAPDIAPEFEVIVNRAMAKDKGDRYLSAGDLGEAVLAATEGRSIRVAERSVAAGEAAPRGNGAPPAPPTRAAATEPSPTRGMEPQARRRRRPVVLGAAAVLVAVVLAAILLVPSSGDEGERPLSRAQYQDRVLDATHPFNAMFVSLDDRLPTSVREPQDGIRAASILTDMRKTNDRLLAALRDITPPQEVEGLHRRMINAFQRIRGHIADAGAAAEVSNNRVYRAVPSKLGAEFATLEMLSPEFRSRGYRRLGF
jgi:Protein kinase domain